MPRGSLLAQVSLRLLVHVERDDVDRRLVMPALPAVAVEEAVDDSLTVRPLRYSVTTAAIAGRPCTEGAPPPASAAPAGNPRARAPRTSRRVRSSRFRVSLSLVATHHRHSCAQQGFNECRTALVACPRSERMLRSDQGKLDPSRKAARRTVREYQPSISNIGIIVMLCLPSWRRSSARSIGARRGGDGRGAMIIAVLGLPGPIGVVCGRGGRAAARREPWRSGSRPRSGRCWCRRASPAMAARRRAEGSGRVARMSCSGAGRAVRRSFPTSPSRAC